MNVETINSIVREAYLAGWEESEKLNGDYDECEECVDKILEHIKEYIETEHGHAAKAVGYRVIEAIGDYRDSI